jgi:hypothetical protein
VAASLARLVSPAPCPSQIYPLDAMFSNPSEIPADIKECVSPRN